MVDWAGKVVARQANSAEAKKKRFTPKLMNRSPRRKRARDVGRVSGGGAAHAARKQIW